MAKTASSSKSESVTLRIPNELFANIRAHAKTSTRGNTSQAIVELIEAGLSAVNSQQDTAVQELQPQLNETRETVTTLAQQVEQLTALTQATILQRLTDLESQFESVLGESNA